MTELYDYDLVVIGSGPAGQKAAIQTAKLGKRIATIDRPASLGGLCIHHGAIPSKTLREAVLYFTGFYHRQVYGVRRKRDLTMQDLMARCAQVVENETRVVIAQLDRQRAPTPDQRSGSPPVRRGYRRAY